MHQILVLPNSKQTIEAIEVFEIMMLNFKKWPISRFVVVNWCARWPENLERADR